MPLMRIRYWTISPQTGTVGHVAERRQGMRPGNRRRSRKNTRGLPPADMTGREDRSEWTAPRSTSAPVRNARSRGRPLRRTGPRPVRGPSEGGRLPSAIGGGRPWPLTAMCAAGALTGQGTARCASFRGLRRPQPARKGASKLSAEKRKTRTSSDQWSGARSALRLSCLTNCAGLGTRSQTLGRNRPR